jgi:hypothetical protein
MTINTVVVHGMLNSNGNLEVADSIALPPGPVEATVRTVADTPGENLGALLARIRAEQQASGRPPRTAEEIDADIRQMHDEWDTP